MSFVAKYVVVFLSVLMLSSCTFLGFNSKVSSFGLVIEKPVESKKEPTKKAPRVKKVRDSVANQLSTQYAKLTPEAKQCMQKYYVGYEYALCLYKNGDMNSAADYLGGFNSDNQLAAELLQKINQPLAYIVNKANQQTDKWLNRKTKLGKFTLQPPTLPKSLSKTRSLSLVKGEFETTIDFKQRVALAKKEIAEKEALIEKHYQEKLAAYNQALNAYNTDLEKEKKERELRSLDVYLDYVNSNIDNVLGEPYFSDPIYDADKQQMFCNLLSNKSNFRQPVVINVALEGAKVFKQNLAKVFPVLKFDATRESLTIASIGAELNGKIYKAQLLDNNQHATSLRNKVVNVNITSDR
ncbi:MAG: hypothetical protein DSY43_01630 [Gammaproteobacteria bacterium]|uniref:Lipoprotein n=1 Tax=endosymbiont of Bathymodiolus septemdierum str. Myojin knoll TaxID=1303921 RepID=A0A0P0USF9_9GAMM|nr:hypothetical protein [Bathymodiolus septemdierum thioautotrophic gill symbiont]RUA06651.1 MAG: hypothetical protein DSY43_01630 [Gammaproteobacteria bacterium]BAS68018.1 hypothetical protein BSEPE_1027 [endosymbiont of Bathymodiolus septemdierum str. Myojin knoll]